MDSRIEEMLKRYSPSNNKEHIVKEILQEIILLGLSRSDFFKRCAFYGGTALRIVHNINRFSEDLDFVICDEEKFNLNDYKKYIEDELSSFGLNFKFAIKDIKPQDKMTRGNVKGNMKEAMITFYPSDEFNKYNPEMLIRIKIEISLIKDQYAITETNYRLLPVPYKMNVYDLPSLYATKIAALLTRNNLTREKGRDYFDYLHYIKLKVKPNLNLLSEKLIRVGYIKKDTKLNYKILKELLVKHFNEVDFNLIKYDIRPLIEDKREIDIWSTEFFTQITESHFKN